MRQEGIPGFPEYIASKDCVTKPGAVNGSHFWQQTVSPAIECCLVCGRVRNANTGELSDSQLKEARKRSIAKAR